MSDWSLRQIAGDQRRIGQTEVREIPLFAKGTWTPRFGATTTDGAYTYTVQSGQWKQWDDTITIFGRVAISAITTPPTGTMRITGLPFTSIATAQVFGGVAFSDISNFNNAANAVQLTGLILNGSVSIELIESFDNAASVNVPAAQFTNAGCSLIFFGQYQIVP